MFSQVHQMIEIKSTSCVRALRSRTQWYRAHQPGQPQWLPLQRTGVYDPNIHNRRSMRLKGYDYSIPGAYLVTVVTQRRAELFGNVVNSKMQLNAAGEMVQRIWMEMPIRFPSIAMDTFVAMPNHIHGIIIMGGADAESRATTRVAPTQDGRIRLGDVVGAFKSLTTLEYTRGVRDMNWAPFHGRLWQRNYYEHILRNDASLQKYRRYIVDNPIQWPIDRENPKREISNQCPPQSNERT